MRGGGFYLPLCCFFFEDLIMCIRNRILATYSQEGFSNWLKDKLKPSNHISFEKPTSIIKRLREINKIFSSFKSDQDIIKFILEFCSSRTYVPSKMRNMNMDSDEGFDSMFDVYKEIDKVYEGFYVKRFVISSSEYAKDTQDLSDHLDEINKLIDKIPKEYLSVYKYAFEDRLQNEIYDGTSSSLNKDFEKLCKKNETFEIFREQFYETLDDRVTHLIAEIWNLINYVQVVNNYVKSL